MPRQIRDTATLDDIEDEILFTTAALKADPDARDLEPMTAGWLALADAVRARDRQTRGEVMAADAARVVANARLDQACIAFGDELYLAVGKDRKAARWTQFFSVAVSRFIRQALSRQIDLVKGWLRAPKDAVLKKHRAALETWSKAAGDAVVHTRAVAVQRGEVWQAREELARDLTRERDGLSGILAERARERGLPRDWPGLFFRITAPSEPDATGEKPAAETGNGGLTP